ncbi:hypothetical protein OHD16_21795 [Sphingobacterium sp. ML3W]|uniref:hypothetical protein n=1 Tax=Sphingobacterium sp. ML3W TaxID=1538644 RepID=UPI00249AA0AD|nr:hypothetical protein [Sphingobacterium sp. ML3W]WFA77362.1 hypothetical protein OGI71_14935 [Sphingobacterium sp. ML3W]
MFGVELIFFRRCLFLVPIFVLAGRVNGQQLTSFSSWEGNFHFANRWIDPFFPLNIQANVVALELDVNDKAKNSGAKQQTIDKVDSQPTEVSIPVVEDSKPKGGIKYSSSRSSTLYRVALDKQLDERYDGKQVFVDAKGVKYIIDSKYRKQIIK